MQKSNMRRDSELLDSVDNASLNEDAIAGNKDELLDMELETLKRMEQLSAGKYRDGKYAESLELQHIVYNTRKRINGERDPATLLTLGNIAATYGRLNMIQIAEETYRKVLNIQTEVLGFRNSDTLMTANHLGVVLKHVRTKMVEGEALMRKAFEGLAILLQTHNLELSQYIQKQDQNLDGLNRNSRNSPTPSTPETTSILSKSGWDTDGSLDLSRLSMLSEFANKDPAVTRARQLNICVAEAAYNLGILYVQFGKRKAAYFYFSRAREGLAAVLGENHSHTLDAMHWEMKCSTALQRMTNTAEQNNSLTESIDATVTSKPSSDYPEFSTPTLPTTAILDITHDKRNQIENSEAKSSAAAEFCHDTGTQPSRNTTEGKNECEEKLPEHWQQPSTEDINTEEIYISRRDWKRGSRMCGLCATKYGLFRREHHCRVCGNSVCYYCCKGRTMVLEYSKSNRVKTCSRCIQQGF